MANTVETLDAITPIKTPADVYYNFFKYTMNDIVKIFPLGFTEVQVVEGEDGKEGCVKLWKYVLGGVTLSAKVLTESIDDSAKTIIFSVLEGDPLVLYKIFKGTISISDGSVKWTFTYEKITLLSPPPTLYGALFSTMCTLVDAYLLIN